MNFDVLFLLFCLLLGFGLIRFVWLRLFTGCWCCLPLGLVFTLCGVCLVVIVVALIVTILVTFVFNICYLWIARCVLTWTLRFAT